MNQGKEQRRHVRLPHRANVKLIAKPPAKTAKLQTRDFSDSGLYLKCEMDILLEVGSLVEVQVLDIEDALVQRARVVRVEPGKGIAVEFLEASDPE